MGIVGSDGSIVKEFVVGVFSDAEVFSVSPGKTMIRVVDKNKNRTVEDSDDVFFCTKDTNSPSFLDEKTGCYELKKDDKSRSIYSKDFMEPRMNYDATLRNMLLEKCVDKFKATAWKKIEIESDGEKHTVNSKKIESFKLTGKNFVFIIQGNSLDINLDGKTDFANIYMVSNTNGQLGYSSYIISAGTYASWNGGVQVHSTEDNEVYKKYLKAFD